MKLTFKYYMFFVIKMLIDKLVEYLNAYRLWYSLYFVYSNLIFRKVDAEDILCKQTVFKLFYDTCI